MDKNLETVDGAHLERDPSHLIAEGLQDRNPELVIQVLRMYPDNLGLQESGCTALALLTRDIPGSRDIVARGDGIDVILKAMAFQSGSEALQTNCAAILANMTWDSENLDNIIEIAVIDQLLFAMRANRDNLKIQGHCCLALCNMTKDPDISTLVLQKGGVQDVILASSTHQQDVYIQQLAFATLRNLASNGEKDREAIIQLGGVKAILAGIQLHKTEPLLVCDGIGALACLSFHNKKNELAVGCIPVVCETTSRHKSDSDIVKNALILLSSLSKSEETQCLVAKYGGIQLAMNAIKDHAARTDIMKYACNTLCNLSLATKVKTTIASQGGAKLLIYAMKMYPADPNVQKSAIAALKNLVAQDTWEHISDIAMTFVDTVVNMLKFHHDDAAIQAEGCMALCNIANQESVAKYMADNGTLATIVNSITQYAESEQIQISGCKALANLLVGHKKNVSIFIQSKGLVVILGTMKRYMTSTGVQEGCCCLLSAVVNDQQVSIPKPEIRQILDLILESLATHLNSSTSVILTGLYVMAALIQNEDNRVYVLSKSGICILTAAVDKLPPDSGMMPACEWMMDCLAQGD